MKFKIKVKDFLKQVEAELEKETKNLSVLLVAAQKAAAAQRINEIPKNLSTQVDYVQELTTLQKRLSFVADETMVFPSDDYSLSRLFDKICKS